LADAPEILLRANIKGRQKKLHYFDLFGRLAGSVFFLFFLVREGNMERSENTAFSGNTPRVFAARQNCVVSWN
jgi:hypothetical protein